MSNREIMLKALNNTVIKDLKAQGFAGKYPHFKRVKEDCIELIDFQTNKYGGSFTVEVSAVFPDSKVTNLSDLTAAVNINKVDVASTNERYRLKGMFDGWFYYRDVYRMPQGFYHDVSEKEAESFEAPCNWDFVQPFDELAADEICEEISVQLEDAFEWLYKFESKNRKHFRPKEENEPEEEKVINKRIFIFICAFVLFFSMGLLLFGFDKAIGGLFLATAIMALAVLIMTPTGYVFSKERVVIKYLFGFEENIAWDKLFWIHTGYEPKSIYRQVYELHYFHKEKKKRFYMNGEIIKNKKTTELMKKYCPKKFN